jgi:two-component system, chemotaxis family, chemotaxis protein CheY
MDKKRKALIIDDSRSMRQMVGMTLKSAGFQVIEGEDGQKGVDALIAEGKVDIIITDLNMPVMDGFEFIRKARAMSGSKFTPILMLTTESSDERKAEGRAAGATGWIVKPFRPEQLIAVVQKVVPA